VKSRTISAATFLLFLGLIAFGPKKTMQFAQEIARVLAQFRRAAEQFQESALAPEPRERRLATKSHFGSFPSIPESI
jgi:Sec-independent protein translocase protein TatA